MATNAGILCRGECLQQVVESEDDAGDDEDVGGEEYDDEGDDEDAGGAEYDDACGDEDFCNFVCQFMSVDCPNPDACVVRQCANFPLCGNERPAWLLECHGGLCVQPCDMMYGRIFQFLKAGPDEACPICLETEATSVVYRCGHMVCAKCYGKTAYNETVTHLMKRCPMCRVESTPLGSTRLRVLG